jgi:hypothetical protein
LRFANGWSGLCVAQQPAALCGAAGQLASNRTASMQPKTLILPTSTAQCLPSYTVDHQRSCLPICCLYRGAPRHGAASAGVPQHPGSCC